MPQVLPGRLVRKENDEKMKESSINNLYKTLEIVFNIFYLFSNKKLINSIFLNTLSTMDLIIIMPYEIVKR